MRSKLGLCLLFCLSPAVALAETAWIAAAKNCDEFAVGVLKVYSSIQGPNLTPDQQEDVRAVIAAACGGTFDHCHFSVCGQAASATPEAPITHSVTPEPIPSVSITAEPVATEAFPDYPTPTEPAETPTPGPSPTELPTAQPSPEPMYTPEPAMTPSATEEPFPSDTPAPQPTQAEATPTPSLPWVKDNMSCPEFLAQLKVRYSPDRTGHALTSHKAELAVALKIACGEKFRHCNFEACQSAPKP